jgi:hypothetical protein
MRVKSYVQTYLDMFDLGSFWEKNGYDTRLTNTLATYKDLIKFDDFVYDYNILV